MKKWVILAAIIIVLVSSSLIYLSTISETRLTTPKLTYEVGGCGDQEVGEIKRGASLQSKVEVSVGDSSIKLLHHLRYVCCAEIEVELASVEEVDGQVLIKLLERNVGEMCRCICSYDVSIKLSGLKPGTYRIQIIGVEFEDMPTEVLWEGIVKV